MGGFGSSRWTFHDKRRTVEDCFVLDIAVLNELGLFSLGYATDTIPFLGHLGLKTGVVHVAIDTSTPEPFLQLRYAVKGWGYHVEDVAQAVSLTTTEPHFGGFRWWFRCFCGRRMGKLYRPPDERHFKCRVCHDLTYTSCQKSHAKSIWERLPNAC